MKLALGPDLRQEIATGSVSNLRIARDKTQGDRLSIRAKLCGFDAYELLSPCADFRPARTIGQASRGGTAPAEASHLVETRTDRGRRSR